MITAFFCYERWASAQWSPVVYFIKPTELPKEQRVNRSKLIEVEMKEPFFNGSDANFAALKEAHPLQAHHLPEEAKPQPSPAIPPEATKE